MIRSNFASFQVCILHHSSDSQFSSSFPPPCDSSSLAVPSPLPSHRLNISIILHFHSISVASEFPSGFSTIFSTATTFRHTLRPSLVLSICLCISLRVSLCLSVYLCSAPSLCLSVCLVLSRFIVSHIMDI